MTTAPRSARRADTVDFPAPIPPVNPTTSTATPRVSSTYPVESTGYVLETVLLGASGASGSPGELGTVGAGRAPVAVSVEDAAEHLDGSEQSGALVGHDDLGVVAVGEAGQRVELEDGHERGIGPGLLDGRVHGGDGLGPAFGLEDGGLPCPLGSQDGRLALPVRLLDGGLGVSLGDVDGR